MLNKLKNWVQSFMLLGGSLTNLYKIGELWGRVMCCDGPTRDCEDFSAAKILVDSPCFPFINNWIWFKTEGVNFKVHVREIYLDSAQFWKGLNDVQVKSKAVSSSPKEWSGDSNIGDIPQVNLVQS